MTADEKDIEDVSWCLEGEMDWDLPGDVAVERKNVAAAAFKRILERRTMKGGNDDS